MRALAPSAWLGPRREALLTRTCNLTKNYLIYKRCQGHMVWCPAQCPSCCVVFQSPQEPRVQLDSGFQPWPAKPLSSAQASQQRPKDFISWVLHIATRRIRVSSRETCLAVVQREQWWGNCNHDCSSWAEFFIPFSVCYRRHVLLRSCHRDVWARIENGWSLISQWLGPCLQLRSGVLGAKEGTWILSRRMQY